MFTGAVEGAFASAFIRHGRMYLYYIYHDIKTYICNSNLFETIIKYYEGGLRGWITRVVNIFDHFHMSYSTLVRCLQKHIVLNQL